MNLFHLDTATALALVLSTLIPALSTLIRRPHWSVGVAGVITLALSTLTGFLTTWADSSGASHYHWQTAAEISLSSFIIAAFARLVLWKDTNTDNALAKI